MCKKESGLKMTSETSPARSFRLTWNYGVKTRDDYIEVEVVGDKQDEKESSSTTATTKTKTIQLKRWSTFKCHYFPDGAIVTGFRGRRDYKDGVCDGIMCCAWCKENNHFITCTYTLSNGYNSKFSVTDFETLKLCNEEEFTSKNEDAISNIQKHFR
jgi:hypothetical protein